STGVVALRTEVPDDLRQPAERCCDLLDWRQRQLRHDPLRSLNAFQMRRHPWCRHIDSQAVPAVPMIATRPPPRPRKRRTDMTSYFDDAEIAVLKAWRHKLHQFPEISGE